MRGKAPFSHLTTGAIMNKYVALLRGIKRY